VVFLFISCPVTWRLTAGTAGVAALVILASPGNPRVQA
jgi:hypothetical protein